MVEELRPEVPGSARAEPPQCLSLAWSADGQTLFAGYSDSMVRVWQVSERFLNDDVFIFLLSGVPSRVSLIVSVFVSKLL